MKSHRSPGKEAPSPGSPEPSAGPAESNEFVASQLPAPEAEGPGVLDLLPDGFLAPDVGADSVTEGAPGPVSMPMGGEANGAWKAVKNCVVGNEFGADGKWRFKAPKFDLDIAWHVRSDGKWDRIEDFPGGPYDPTFNTLEGTREHELAEVTELMAVWQLVKQQVLAFQSQAFDSEAALIAAIKTDVVPFMEYYEETARSLGNHTNPAGPDAEWAYYERASGGAAGTPEEPK